MSTGVVVAWACGFVMGGVAASWLWHRARERDEKAAFHAGFRVGLREARHD